MEFFGKDAVSPQSELRRIANEVGKQRLAAALGWTVRTLDRKLSGQHAITKTDALAVRHVVECDMLVK